MTGRSCCHHYLKNYALIFNLDQTTSVDALTRIYVSAVPQIIMHQTSIESSTRLTIVLSAGHYGGHLQNINSAV